MKRVTAIMLAQLEQQGKMADYGRAKIEEAKRNGQWDAQSLQLLQMTR